LSKLSKRDPDEPRDIRGAFPACRFALAGHDVRARDASLLRATGCDAPALLDFRFDAAQSSILESCVATNSGSSVTGRIFINYRRETSAGAAGRLFDRLSDHFDGDQLFMDVDDIEPGVDFVKALDDQVARCAAFIAVIDQGWLDVKGADGSRRLDDPHDYVRLEIEAALKRDIRVVPVLMSGARMPRSEELPPALQAFTRRNAFPVSHHRFAADVDELVRSLQKALGIPPKAPKDAAAGADRDLAATRATTWTEYLFSFKGRISRKPFWLSGLAITVTTVVLYVALALAMGDAAFVIKDEAMLSQPSQQLKAIYSIASLTLYWPTLALFLKRLHDLGHGIGFFLPIVLLTVMTIVFDVAGLEQAMLSTLLVVLASWLVIGCIKGAVGPNEYGPDPLADIRNANVTPA
jgi:uncharacterized membrane protein YhaH (DUF805 family)